jgi:hypothetical protein
MNNQQRIMNKLSLMKVFSMLTLKRIIIQVRRGKEKLEIKI